MMTEVQAGNDEVQVGLQSLIQELYLSHLSVPNLRFHYYNRLARGRSTIAMHLRWTLIKMIRLRRLSFATSLGLT